MLSHETDLLIPDMGNMANMQDVCGLSLEAATEMDAH